MSQYEDIQKSLAARAAAKKEEYRDREHVSWSPWLVPAVSFSWTGPTYPTGPQFIPTGGITAARWMGARYTFNWSTPVFDLRPELREIVNFPPNGVPIWNHNARLYIEVYWPWETTGTGWVTPPVGGLGDPNQAVFNQFWAMAQEEVSTTEYQIQTPSATAAAAYDSVYPSTTWYPLNPSPGMGAADVMGTPNAANDPRTLSYRFAPAGTELQGVGGTPIRYWRLRISFFKLAFLSSSSTTDVPVPYNAPQFTLRAGLY